MRGLIVLAGALVAALVAALWFSGGFDAIARFAAEAQRGFQTDMARSLRALKGGETAAVLGLLALSFGYGVAHAAGPGHGKFLIGGYGLGRRVGFMRLAMIALVSSLAQAVTAILFVGTAFAALGWARERVTDLADRTLEPLSYGLIGLIGLWLAVRGLRHLSRGVTPAPEAAHHDHHHGHDHDHVHGPDCDHAHLPDADAIAGARNWRELAVLVGAVAVRPCTGALFVLVLTFAMGIPLAGVGAAFAMALGTAVITIAVAAGAVSMREGLFASLSGSRALALAMPLAEVVAGGLIATLAAMLVIRAF